MKNIRISFASQLKRLRKTKKVTQVELAKLLEVSNSSVAMWETSARVPPIEKIVEIADLFGVSIDYLVRGYDFKEEITNE